MKKLMALLLSLVLSVSLVGCSGDKDKSSGSAGGTTQSQTLRWNLPADPKTIDPGLNAASDGGHIINNTFEGLYRIKNDEAQPAIAEKVDISQDGLTYTFTLRDTKWSDGKPLTANDFVYSWKRLVNPSTMSEYGFILQPVKNAMEIYTGEQKDVNTLGVEAVDEKTLKVTLGAPCAYFLDLTAFPSLYPVREDVAENTGAWAKNPEKAISNGPFKVTGYTMNDQLVLEKNDQYWNKDNVSLEKIIVKMMTDEATALTAYNGGELDLLIKLPVDEIPQLIATGDAEVLPQVATYFYVINAQTKELSDVRVRKALSLAIDRKAITEQVTRAGETPAMGLVPYGFTDPSGKDFREVVGDYGIKETANIEEAKKLLAQAGYPDGKGIPQFEILYNTGDTHKAIAEAVQEMWKQIGINVKLNNQEWAVCQETRMNLQYKGAARHGWSSDYLDPQSFLEIFVSGSKQSGNGYASAAYDAALQKALSSTGQERYNAFYECERILMEDSYVIPIYYYVDTILAKETLTGWYMSPVGKLWLGDAKITA